MGDGLEAGAAIDRGSPNWLLVSAAASVGLAVLLLAGGFALHILGYLLASLVAFTLVAIYRKRALERTAQVGIGVPRWIELSSWGVLLVGLVIAIAHAWFIAGHLS